MIHSGRRHRTVLAEVIGTYMNSLDQNLDDDIIRSFFRNHVSVILPYESQTVPIFFLFNPFFVGL